MNRALEARLARLEALRGAPLAYVLLVRTPGEADQLLAGHSGRPLIVVPPIAETVEEWLQHQPERYSAAACEAGGPSPKARRN